MSDRQLLVASVTLTLLAALGSSIGCAAEPLMPVAAGGVVSNPSAPPLEEIRPNRLQFSSHAQWYAARHSWHDAFIDNYPELRSARYKSRNPDAWCRKEILATKGWFAYIAGHGPAIWTRY